MEGQQPQRKKGFSFLQVAAMVLAAMVLAAGVILVVVHSWLFPRPFAPVHLSPGEERRLEEKLDRLEYYGARGHNSPGGPSPPQPSARDLAPEPYSEADALREIVLSEREVNGLIARSPDLSTRLVVHFSRDLVSVKLLVPLDPDFPLLGGRILKVNAGAELAFRDGRPVVILRGVSVMGVPLPRAWLGGFKDIDLIQAFGTEPGFWKGFADGIAAVEVGDGRLRIVLRP